jgi:hypothetical protein
MSESHDPPEAGESQTDEDLDVEGPNEGGPGSEPEPAPDKADELRSDS